MNMSYMCRYNIDEVCTNYNCDECKQHPMYQQGRADREKELSELPNAYSEKLWKIAYQQGARKFAEWLANGCSFIRRLGEDDMHTVDELIAEWQKENKGDNIIE